MSKPESTDGDGAPTGEARVPLAPMDFSTFVMSLASSVMVNLGLIPAPDEQETHKDIDAAKQIIDILGMLEEKTRGNLSESELKLFTSLLYDLRIQYTDAKNQT
jgi:Na+-transporting NADH:ubiquinone oxidoreductase subunit NqrC